MVSKASAASTRKRSTAKKTATKSASRTTAKKAAAKKTATPKKAVAKKTTAKKTSTSKKKATPAKRTAAKTPAKKTTTTRKTAAKSTAAKTKAAKSTKATRVSKPSTKAKTTTKKGKSTVSKLTATKTAAKTAVKTTRAKTVAPKKKAAPKSRKQATKKVVLTSAQGLLNSMGIEPYQQGAKEEYMSDLMCAHFVKILELWGQQLREKVDLTVNHMQDQAANHADPSDRATQEEEFRLLLRAGDRERKLIRKIEKTINQIKQPNSEFGYCETCGVEIGLRRLEARPIATQCIDCKTIDEMREQQQTG